MQLKRDTDYALRVLYCLKQHDEANPKHQSSGLTLSEIAAQTGLTRLVAARICECLCDKGILRESKRPDKEDTIFSPRQALSSLTLLDVVVDVEGTGQLFAVFDKKSAAYRSCEAEMMSVQRNAEKVLAQTTLDSLFTTKGS